jgi:hypothetical protein
MVLTSFSHVLLRLLVSLLVLRLERIVLREAILNWSLAMWVGVAFSLLHL